MCCEWMSNTIELPRKKGGKVNLYRDLASRSVARFVRDLRSTGQLYVNDDGKLTPHSRRVDPDQWIRTRGEGHSDYECKFANMVLWDMISKKCPTPFVPSHCQSCWKVCAKPKTFKQLSEILFLQDRQDRRAKCGIETRYYVPALYGAYWYTRSKEEGLDLYKEFKGSFEFAGVPLILKRGCTEMEIACGPSDKWEVTDWQIEIEDIARGLIVDDIVIERGYDWQRDDTLLRWMEFAEEHGDETVWEYTEGLYINAPSYVMYHTGEPTKLVPSV